MPFRKAEEYSEPSAGGRGAWVPVLSPEVGSGLGGRAQQRHPKGVSEEHKPATSPSAEVSSHPALFFSPARSPGPTHPPLLFLDLFAKCSLKPDFSLRPPLPGPDPRTSQLRGGFAVHPPVPFQPCVSHLPGPHDVATSGSLSPLISVTSLFLSTPSLAITLPSSHLTFSLHSTALWLQLDLVLQHPRPRQALCPLSSPCPLCSCSSSSLGLQIPRPSCSFPRQPEPRG